MSTTQTDTDRAQGVTSTETFAWCSAVVLFVVGDAVTTLLGFQLGAVESNPYTAAMIGTVGFWPAFLGMKLLVLAWVVACWWFTTEFLPDAYRPYRVAFPALIAGMGAIVVGLNLRILLLITGVL